MEIKEQEARRGETANDGGTESMPSEYSAGSFRLITESPIPALNNVPPPQLDDAQRDLHRSFSAFFAKYIEGLMSGMRLLDTAALLLLIDDLFAARARNAQIFVIGNGGSAAVASHLANDLGKQRFDDPKYSFRVLSLTDNLPWITATANDFGYEHIFVNQLKNLLQPDDLVIGISSSGNSQNIISAVEYANSRGAKTWGIVGFNGGRLKQAAQSLVYTPSCAGQYGFAEDLSAIVCHIVSIFMTERDTQENRQARA